MNEIVEINYPNLDSYFKELLLKQEFSRKCYWSAIKENLSDSLAFFGDNPFSWIRNKYI